MFNLRNDIKNFFFDREAVKRQVADGTLKRMMHVGGLVRKIARQSMRRRKNGYSPPGSPPFAKIGTLRDQLFFGYDPSSGTVVVGPVGLGKAEVPGLHEFGGRATRTKLKFPGRKATVVQAAFYRDKIRKGEIQPKPRSRVTYQANYAPRPFMGPALDKVVGGGIYANSFRDLMGPRPLAAAA